MDTRHDPLLELILAGWSSMAIGAAVELGLPELLADSPRDPATLAAAAGCDADALERLLDALASLGLVEWSEAATCTLTARGQRLRRDAPDGLAAQARWFAGHSLSLFADLAESVRSGRSVRQRRGGRPGYGHISQDTQAATLFNQAMHELTRLIAPAVAAAVDWRGVGELLDVGGGHGELLAVCLQTCRAVSPQARGRLLELDHALPGARARLAAAGLADCSTVQAGDFFQAIAPGADRVLLKAVLHNWDDAHCAQILSQVRRALNPGGRLLLIERLRPDRPSDATRDRLVARSDLNMLVALGGRERRRGEFERLLRATGYAAPRLTPVGEGFVVMEAALVEAALVKAALA